MALTLSSDTETALNALAAQHGQAPETLLDALIRRAAQEERERQDTVAGIQTGLADFAAGQWIALEDLDPPQRPLPAEHAA